MQPPAFAHALLLLAATCTASRSFGPALSPISHSNATPNDIATPNDNDIARANGKVLVVDIANARSGECSGKLLYHANSKYQITRHAGCLTLSIVFWSILSNSLFPDPDTSTSKSPWSRSPAGRRLGRRCKGAFLLLLIGKRFASVCLIMASMPARPWVSRCTRLPWQMQFLRCIWALSMSTCSKSLMVSLFSFIFLFSISLSYSLLSPSLLLIIHHDLLIILCYSFFHYSVISLFTFPSSLYTSLFTIIVLLFFFIIYSLLFYYYSPSLFIIPFYLVFISLGHLVANAFANVNLRMGVVVSFGSSFLQNASATLAF